MVGYHFTIKARRVFYGLLIAVAVIPRSTDEGDKLNCSDRRGLNGTAFESVKV
jgi:hypothetical protein